MRKPRRHRPKKVSKPQPRRSRKRSTAPTVKRATAKKKRRRGVVISEQDMEWWRNVSAAPTKDVVAQVLRDCRAMRAGGREPKILYFKGTRKYSVVPA